MDLANDILRVAGIVIQVPGLAVASKTPTEIIKHCPGRWMEIPCDREIS